MASTGPGNGVSRGLRVRLIGEGDESRAAIKALVEGLGEPAAEIEIDGAAAAPDRAGSPDVVMVLLAANDASAIQALREQTALNPRPAVFALLDSRSPALMKRAMRAGADELLFVPLDNGETTRALLKVSEARLRISRREGGVVCSFASVTGGVGVTSLAANLGIALRRSGKRVALFDLDLQTGALGVTLGLEPEATILPLVRLDRKLDSIQLESAMTKHPSGLYLLSAPKRIEEGETVSDVTVATVIGVMRQLFDFVLIDCGDHVDENSVAAWEHSDHIFYVLQQSITSARCAWRFIDLFERLGLSSIQPHFILNRYRPAHPITDKQIEATLERELYARVPADDRSVERAEVTAKNLWEVAPASPLVHALDDVARRIAPADPESAAAENGLFARLKSALATRA